MHQRSHFRSAVILALAVAVPALPSAAGAEQEGWSLRLSGVSISPDVDLDQTDDDGIRTRADSDSELGLALSLEYRVSRRVGVEFGLASAQPDINVRVDDAAGGGFTTSDGIGFTPITAGLNFHLTPNRPVDLYAGPVVAYVLYDDLSFEVAGLPPARFESDDDFGWGLNLGADVSFGDGRWMLHLGAGYLDTTLEVTDEDGGRTDVDFDPISLAAGVTYRF